MLTKHANSIFYKVILSKTNILGGFHCEMHNWLVKILDKVVAGEIGLATTIYPKIYQLYPELKAYLLYQAPYFRLRVGNFRDKDEAEEYRKLLSKEFPNSVFLVRDTIEVKLSDPNL